MDHQTFIDHPQPAKVKHLRELCTAYGILPEYNKDVAAFESWLAEKLITIKVVEDRQLIAQYAKWVHLNRMRDLAEKGELRPATVLSARQSTNVGAQFLGFLRSRGTKPANCIQPDIDDWLASGPTTHSLARSFARWAMRQQHIPRLSFPYRVAKTSPIIGQSERIAWLRIAIDADSALRPFIRAAMLLLLLFAQPLSRIAEMKADQLAIHENGVLSLTGVGLDPIEIIAPFDRPFIELLAARPNMNTAANAQSEWLFPGGSPGRHLTAVSLMTNIREAGVDLRGAKSAALRKLVLEMPAALVADSFGYSYERTEIHSRAAGKQFADYAGLSAEKAR